MRILELNSYNKKKIEESIKQYIEKDIVCINLIEVYETVYLKSGAPLQTLSDSYTIYDILSRSFVNQDLDNDTRESTIDEIIKNKSFLIDDNKNKIFQIIEYLIIGAFNRFYENMCNKKHIMLYAHTDTGPNVYIPRIISTDIIESIKPTIRIYSPSVKNGEVTNNWFETRVI